jgi:hypothetical protein
MIGMKQIPTVLGLIEKVIILSQPILVIGLLG